MYELEDVIAILVFNFSLAVLLQEVFHHQSGQVTIRRTMPEEGIRMVLLRVNNSEIDKSYNPNFKEAEVTKARYCLILTIISHP